MLKRGRSLAVMSVGVTSSADGELVAQAQVTYHIPSSAPAPSGT